MMQYAFAYEGAKIGLKAVVCSGGHALAVVVRGHVPSMLCGMASLVVSLPGHPHGPPFQKAQPTAGFAGYLLRWV